MCTLEKRGNLFILTLTGSDEQHRLSPTLIDSIRSCLSSIKSQSLAYPSSSYALITRSSGKFFSNGFDLAWAQSSGTKSGFTERIHHMTECFKPLIADLLSLRMPTIAAVTGHAAAAGFLLVLSHDYVLMRNDRGVMYMSELDIGLTIPDYFRALFGEKVGSPMARREILLRAKKLKGEEGVKMGIVDKVFDGEEKVVEEAMKLGEELVGRKWNGEVYAEIRKGLYPELCRELGLSCRSVVAPRL